MARIKVDYGIDLGTTNSAIARMESGEPTIIKSDVQKDTLPSCVSFNRRQAILAGDSAMNAFKSDKLKAMGAVEGKVAFNSFIEFKRTMGTDKKYVSSNMGRPYSSEELSAEVLKKLKSFVTTDELKSVVITVPAKFTINQKDATVRAATLAGFTHCELLQEPIAASMAYGLDSAKKDGLWLVFDFGGGTFDAALLRIEEGIMSVIDTEGDNYLGGKNIDYAIVDEVVIPYLATNFNIESILGDIVKKEVFREAMKPYAESSKIQLSFKDTDNIMVDLGDIPGEDDEGNEFELDITLTQADMDRVAGPLFQKAITICQDLLKRNNLSGNQLDALILVGGPTYSPVLRRMLKEQISDKVDTRVDPMTAVAKGAALFASTINISDELIEQSRDRTKIQLNLGYNAQTVESDEWVTVKVLKDKTAGTVPGKLFVELTRADKAWSSNKIPVGEVGELIDIKLVEGKTNSFTVSLYNEFGDRLPCEPSEFTIIHGVVGPPPTLPYHMGVEVQDMKSGKSVFHAIKGLEKNQSLPATGIQSGLRNQKVIRPGVKEDSIEFRLYQGDYNAEGSKAIHNEHVYTLTITGEDLPALLPQGSEMNLTLKFDRSEKMIVQIHFPSLNYTEEIIAPRGNTQKEVSANLLQSKITEAKQVLAVIRQENTYDNPAELDKLSAEFKEFENLLEQSSTDYDRKKQILNNLRSSLMKLDVIESQSEWPRIEKEMKDDFYQLEELFKTIEGQVEELNDERVKQAIADFKRQIPQVIQEKNAKVASDLIDQMGSLDFALRDAIMGVQMEISHLQHYQKYFDEYNWKKPDQARIIINKGLQVAANNPTKQQLRPVLIELYKLLPDEQKPGADESLPQKV